MKNQNNKEQITKLAAEIVAAAAPNGNTLVCDARAKIEKMITLALLGLEASYAQEKIAEASNATACARSLETLGAWLQAGEPGGRQIKAEAYGPRFSVRLWSGINSHSFGGVDLADALAQAASAAP